MTTPCADSPTEPQHSPTQKRFSNIRGTRPLAMLPGVVGRPSAVLFTVHACAPRPCSKYAPRPCLNAPDIRSRPFLESRQQQPASPRYPANSCTAMQGCWITKLQHLALPTYNKEVLSHQLSAETKPSTVDTSQPAPLSNKESERHSQTLETKVMSCVTHSFTFFSMKSRLLCV
jgi:hypothetical protein